MKFSEELNNYINLLNCSAKDLSKISGLSPTLISRYLSGKRNPRNDSEYLERLVDGLYKIASEKNIKITKKSIKDTLVSSINPENINYNNFINNFNTLLIELKINISDFANNLGYDTSFISRMKNNERKPSDLNNFIDKVSVYVFNICKNPVQKNLLCSLLDCSLEDLLDNSKYKKLFVDWILSSGGNSKLLVKNFLTSLDNFNLNDYISTDFTKIKVPTSPVILRNSKTYYGNTGRKQAEADFLKTTLISKSDEPIFFYSNLPISEAGKDENFKKRWILAITMLLKKGLHLNMVHDISRPLNEMLLGLESWLPIYMTGSISPYYFENRPSNMFLNMHCTSGSVSLIGEYIKGENCRFYLTTKKEELIYFKEKSKYLLSKAKPLMKIYKEKDNNEFNEFIKKENVQDLQKIKKDSFKNIDFYIGKKWIMINKLNYPKIHFVIYNEKLLNPLKAFLE